MRRTDPQRVQDIWQAVRQEPGIRPGRIAQKLDIPRSSVTRALPALDEAGMLLSEDRRGRLWPWKEK
jgi:Mn-dependent DtxR family transcriptional regulator